MFLYRDQFGFRLLGLIAIWSIVGFRSPLLAQELDDPAIGLKVDQSRLTANRIRKLSGKHLVLFTDLPSENSVDELPIVFDQAVKHWSDYFGVADKGLLAVGFLIKDRERFLRAGVFPNNLPEFKNGYTFGKRTFWIYDQPSPYMRRQLLIHEGTHVFLFSRISVDVPAWYNEGMAEWFGAHRWDGKTLRTRFVVEDRDDAPYWGRVRKVREAVEDGNALSVRDVMELKNESFLRVEPYTWVWALTAFLDRHPDYQTRFRKLADDLHGGKNINQAFENSMRADWSTMEEQWRAFLNDVDYGVRAADTKIEYDVAKKQNKNLPVIVATKSWQNSGIRVESGKSYWIRSKGRYVIGESVVEGRKTAWPCEPNGISLEYYRGQPLGKLMMVVKPDRDGALMRFDQSVPVGLSLKWKADFSGTIFFRVNESPAGLKDNSGTLLVSVVELD